MGRKLPPFAPAGRKRKGPSFPTLSPCKLRRTTEASGWASLPTDLIHLVTSRLLSGDVVDYISFRAVCSGWRSSTPEARDPTLRKSDLRPRGWVALCDGDGVRPDAACEITFFHTRTAKRLRGPSRTSEATGSSASLKASSSFYTSAPPRSACSIPSRGTPSTSLPSDP